MTTAGAAYADGVITTSTQTGIATDKLQEYMYAAELIDVSTETLTKSMAKQIKSMKGVQDGTKASVEAYNALGVSVLDSNGKMRDSDTVYWEVIDALGKMENETERDALAMQILGKSAQELNPLIEAGAERMNELGAEARAAGYVVGEDMLAAYGALDDQLQYLSVGATAAKNALGTVLLPVLTDLAGEGVDLLGEFTNGILAANGDIGQMSNVIGEILPKALTSIMEYVPVLLELIGTIIGSLGQAIVNNLPLIVDSATQIVFSILSGLIQALPQIAEGAVQLVLALVEGIVANLPMLIEAAAQVVTTILTGIGNALPTLIPAAVLFFLIHVIWTTPHSQTA
jgi:phage-related protein